MEPSIKRERLRRFEEACRARRLPLTVQRRAIFEAVLDSADHPTADRVYQTVRTRIPGVSRTTVYRVLDALVDVGVIVKACSPGAAARFDAMTARHHHLVCLRCEKLIDVVDERLDRQIRLPDVRPHVFRIQDFSVHFHGICAGCRRKERSKGQAARGRSDRVRTSSRYTDKKPRQAKRRNKT